MYGDTAAGRKRVAQLREQGGDIRALAARLVAQAEAVPWHGKAAESMRDRIKGRAHHLRAAAAQHETAAESLAAHLSEVDSLKERDRDPQPQGDHPRRGRPHPCLPSSPTAPSPTMPTPPCSRSTLLPAGHQDWLTVDLPGL